jgi:hypothetical protein
MTDREMDHARTIRGTVAEKCCQRSSILNVNFSDIAGKFKSCNFMFIDGVTCREGSSERQNGSDMKEKDLLIRETSQ